MNIQPRTVIMIEIKTLKLTLTLTLKKTTKINAINTGYTATALVATPIPK